MKKTLLTLSLLFLISSFCCAEDTVGKGYYTSFGNIPRGFSQEQVKQMLGEPKYSRTYKDIDVWYYYFNQNSRLFVYFRDGKVMNVGIPTNKEA